MRQAIPFPRQYLYIGGRFSIKGSLFDLRCFWYQGQE